MADHKKLKRLYLTPLIILLLGILSVVLLMSVYRIDKRLYSYSEQSDAIMDIQIYTATSHFLVEEVIHGDVIVHEKKPFPGLDQAISLAGVTLYGGVSEHGFVLPPLTDPELHTRTEAVRSKLMEFKALSAKRLHNHDNSITDPAVDKKFHETYKDVSEKLKALENDIETKEAESRNKSMHAFRIVMTVWTFIVVYTTVAIWGLERKRGRVEVDLVEVNKQLFSQREELTGHQKRLSGLVEKRTAGLMEAEKQCRSLSSRLLEAQEIERKRISMELHDALGQALSAMKLQTRTIETALEEDQGPIKQGCEKLREYMDHTIEEVRRLSLNLSPAALENIGLTSSIRWLAGTLTKTPATEVILEIEDIDHLFPKKRWITIYRVVQEALTNIEKHAQAENVSLVIQRMGDSVAFSIEDDGNGFNMKRASTQNTHETGLGLTTMNERVMMIGGGLDLRSAEGEGTRISFSVPIEREEG